MMRFPRVELCHSPGPRHGETVSWQIGKELDSKRGWNYIDMYI